MKTITSPRPANPLSEQLQNRDYLNRFEKVRRFDLSKLLNLSSSFTDTFRSFISNPYFEIKNISFFNLYGDYIEPSTAFNATFVLIASNSEISLVIPNMLATRGNSHSYCPSQLEDLTKIFEMGIFDSKHNPSNISVTQASCGEITYFSPTILNSQTGSILSKGRIEVNLILESDYDWD